MLTRLCGLLVAFSPLIQIAAGDDGAFCSSIRQGITQNGEVRPAATYCSSILGTQKQTTTVPFTRTDGPLSKVIVMETLTSTVHASTKSEVTRSTERLRTSYTTISTPLTGCRTPTASFTPPTSVPPSATQPFRFSTLNSAEITSACSCFPFITGTATAHSGYITTSIPTTRTTTTTITTTQFSTIPGTVTSISTAPETTVTHYTTTETITMLAPYKLYDNVSNRYAIAKQGPEQKAFYPIYFSVSEDQATEFGNIGSTFYHGGAQVEVAFASGRGSVLGFFDGPISAPASTPSCGVDDADDDDYCTFSCYLASGNYSGQSGNSLSDDGGEWSLVFESEFTIYAVGVTT